MNGRCSQEVKGQCSQEVRGGGFLSWGRWFLGLGPAVDWEGEGQ
jgi:hypothetical protein